MSVLRRRVNGCALFPPITRLITLVTVMIFVIVLLNRGYSLISALTATLAVGLIATRIGYEAVMFSSLGRLAGNWGSSEWTGG